MSVVPLQLCLAGKEVTDIRVRPGGQWVSGVVSEPGLHGTVSRLGMWSVAHRDVVVDLVVDDTLEVVVQVDCCISPLWL